GEHADRAAVRLEHVGQVRESVPGRVHDPYPHARSGLEDVTVAHGEPLETHLVVGGDHVLRPHLARQRVAAGDVVVVDVRLEHVGDLQPTRGDEFQDAVDVALRVDDHGVPPVVREVTAVPQGGCVDDDDFDQ